MSTQIPDKLTPIPLDGLISAVAEGYRRLMSSIVAARCLAVLSAQACLETGNGQKMHRYNPGNKKLPKDWAGEFCQFACDEIFDAATAAHAATLGPCVRTPWRGGPLVRCVLSPPHPWTSFVAFHEAGEGFADWLELLALTDRYRVAWSRAYAGDAAGFVRALGAARYFTADEPVYEKAVVSIAARILPACARIAANEDHDLTDEDRAHVAAMVYEATQQSAEEALHGEAFPLADTEPSGPPDGAA
jgi:hypothetical protein